MRRLPSVNTNIIKIQVDMKFNVGSRKQYHVKKVQIAAIQCGTLYPSEVFVIAVTLFAYNLCVYS
jgi:hypothetical protein